MIDLKEKKPTAKALLVELLLNAPALLLMLYGLKCIITLQGKMPMSVRGTIYRNLHLKSVSDSTAVNIGLAYTAFGLFLYLSDGPPPDEGRSWWWRILRSLLRWGGLVAAGWFSIRASELAGFTTPMNLPPAGYSLLVRLLAYACGFVGLLSFLSAMYQREAVKRDLAEQVFEPRHIWWCPAAYWTPWLGYWGSTGFRVIYSDADGFTHKAYCFVYRSFAKDFQWGSRRVVWLRDVVGERVG